MNAQMCFSGYTAPGRGDRLGCMRVRGHGGAHTCAGVTWSDAEANRPPELLPYVVELPVEIRCASLHVGIVSKALYACTREPGHAGEHESGIVSWTDHSAVQ